MEKVNITINGQKLQVPKNYTVLEAAKSANIDIPTLCYLKDINEIGACRMCVVEIKGARSLQAACVYPVSEGLEIKTNTPAVRESRKVTLELILSNHEKKCLTCVRSGNCELQKLAEELNVKDIRFEGETYQYTIDDFSPSIARDPNKCVLCRRCVSVCKKPSKRIMRKLEIKLRKDL
jgi:NADP-reducing hydrogenase subunit HndD